MHLDFRVKPGNDRKDTFGTSPKTQKKDACLKQFLQKTKIALNRRLCRFYIYRRNQKSSQVF